MEKLTVEIELAKKELDAFNAFIEQGCIDKSAYLKRLIVRAAERHDFLMRNKRAGEAKRTA